MNQDQVKQILLKLDEDVEEFSLIFSGKKSKKVNGLYHPDTREIIIHNKNFGSENALMYTAIHEFAHHIHFTRSPTPISSRTHTTSFRNIFHHLLAKAEKEGFYHNIFQAEQDFIELTERIKEGFLRRNGALMKELGSLLKEAEDLCFKHHARFEDYVERILSLDTRSAHTMIKFHLEDISPDIGYENMKTVAGMKSPEERKIAQESFLRGDSPDMVKEYFNNKKKDPDDPKQELLKEKRRIQRTIESLSKRLEDIESRLSSLDNSMMHPSEISAASTSKDLSEDPYSTPS